MGKRVGFLMESITDPDNLRLAFYKAQKGKTEKPEVIEYRKNLDRNLCNIRDSLSNQTISVGNYHYFIIHDPKERLICAATFPERVLHHALMNVCHPFFEKFQIYDSYATRINKGQYAALERAQKFAAKYKWFCKIDIRKFFDSIDHTVLIDKLKLKFKDPGLMSVFEKIVFSYYTTKGKGLPIGNLTSQYFANFYLGFADHFIKEQLRVMAYVRYMDDMVLWSNDKNILIEKANLFGDYLVNELKLTPKPLCINQQIKGLSFLGYVVFNSRIRLNKRSRKRFITRMNVYNLHLKNEIWSQATYANHVIPLIAFTKKADSYYLRSQVIIRMEAS
jgi:RNA-directed DNA polymerase